MAGNGLDKMYPTLLLRSICVTKIQCLFHVFFYPLSIVQSVSNKRNLFEDSVWNTFLFVEAHVENLSLFQDDCFEQEAAKEIPVDSVIRFKYVRTLDTNSSRSQQF